ncbi:LysR family transcriptional regulator [Sphingobacterium arenae]|uniref:LysR family transcriptional regulator n=1 Tax=Sphingobacterium arenae TaxID=1280598 RepID=A0ABR7Y5W1_9SPHI|nr:LysR family transcriptional regulator [Sphingobacterium arenae]MBD1426667.1 LysR family transcriptional regulator [Sphingobacterium arenae]
MNTNDLKLFEAVALHGNFTKAAEAMYTVQSNVTARIKNLEEEFGATLFLRTSRKVELTSAGKKVLLCCKQINNLIENTKFAVGKDDKIKGQLKVGFLETTMALKGPDLINELAEKFPLIDIDFTSAMRDKLIEDVLNFKLDAAFIPMPIFAEELEKVVINEERIVIVAPERFNNVDELLKQPRPRAIVFDQGCFFRTRLEAWLVNKNITNYNKTVMNSMEGVINFIESGIGFSLLPSEIISAFYKDRKIKTFPLPAEIGKIKNVLVYRKDNLSSPVLNAFIGLF